MMRAPFFFYLVLPCWTLVHGLNCSQTCKTTHKSPNWPSGGAWSQLNQTLGGKLLAPLPPAIVCDTTTSHYNADACNEVSKDWVTDLFLDNDPLSLHQPNWQNDSCIPPSVFDSSVFTTSPSQPSNTSVACNLAPFARYVVNASQPQDVVDAVKFAQAHNLRLSVKNTGHDYLGRSTSPDFQLWTHYLTGIELHPQFQADKCPNGGNFSAITVHAGNQWGQVYNFTNQHGILAPGGSDPSVGVGGHLLGGGHGPFGAIMGLEVDNVLQMTVVTPAGDLVTANECQNSDLFWAMKGGGGSTFGVLITATLKTYPDVSARSIYLSFGSTAAEASENNNANFYDLLASMHTEIISWSDNFIGGYLYWGPSAQVPIAAGVDVYPPPNMTNQSANISLNSLPQSLVFVGWGLNQSLSQLNATMWPIAEKLNATQQSVPGVLSLDTFTPSHHASDTLHTNVTGTAGQNIILTSRLWDKNALLNHTALVQTFRRLGSISVFNGLLVSGPAVRDESKIATTSVTPAWRRTYMHLISFGLPWGDRNATEQAFVRSLQTNQTQVLYDQAPDTGAYMNEADVEQPNAPQAFWGDNYQRLLALKREYDPQGMFWCKPCIGWEDWTMDPATGALCRK